MHKNCYLCFYVNARFVKKYPRILLILLLALLAGCQPEGVISPKGMTDLLADLYLTDGYLEATPGSQGWDTLNIYRPVLDAHGVTAGEFEASVDYYLHHPSDFVKIYKKVKKKLEAENRAFEEEQMARDQKALDTVDLAKPVKQEIVEGVDKEDAGENPVEKPVTKPTRKRMSKKEMKELEKTMKK